MLLKITKKLIHYFLVVVIVAYIIFEELVWERFAQPLIRLFSRLRLTQKLSHFLQTLDSRLILLLFVALFIIVEFQGLYAASLFFHGKMIHGMLVYAGKVPISAFTFWLFNNVKPKLMEFIWFERAYIYIMMLIDKITHSQIYLNIKVKTAPVKRYIKKNLASNKGSFKARVEALYHRLRTFLKKPL